MIVSIERQWPRIADDLQKGSVRSKVPCTFEYTSAPLADVRELLKQVFLPKNKKKYIQNPE